MSRRYALKRVLLNVFNIKKNIADILYVLTINNVVPQTKFAVIGDYGEHNTALILVYRVIIIID